MPTAKSVKIQNNFTERASCAPSRPVLDSKWLLQNYFYIDGEWATTDPVPWDLGLNMRVSASSRYAGEEVFIDLCKIKRFMEKPTSFDWLGEKQLEKKIKSEMSASCASFADDFLPTAMIIVVRAQEKAKKIVAAEYKKRATQQKKKKVVKKVAKKLTKKKATKKKGG